MNPRRWAFFFLVCIGPGTALGACGDDPKGRLGANCGGDADCEQGVCGGGICIDPLADGDRDGLPDVLESATLDDDNDCIPNQFDARNNVPDADPAGLVAVVCKQEGVCGASRASLAVVCDLATDKRTARCDYAAVPDFEDDEARCDGLDNDCDGAIDEQAQDLDDDGQADCIDDDDDGDAIADVSDLCPTVVDPGQRDSDGDGVGDACDVPAPPVVTGTDPVSPATDATPTLIGVADALTTVEVFAGTSCGDTPLATATSAGDGSFTVSVQAGDNRETRFVLRARNAAGLTSVCIRSAFSYLHDDTTPDAPTFTAIVPTSPATDDSPRVSGRAEANARIELHASADCTGAPLDAGNVDAGGAFSLIIAVPNNASTIVYAAAIDRAGNRSACATLTTYVHDGERPDPPTAHPTPFTPGSPSADDPNPLLRGCAEDGATVDIYSEDGCLGALEATLVAAAEDEQCPGGVAFFGLVAATPNATTTFFGQVRGARGRISACVPLGVYAHDSSAPTAPVLVSVSPSSPSSLRTPTLVGSAEPGVAVTLHRAATCDAASRLGGGTAAADGAFVIVATLPANSGTTIYAKATDSAGNASPCAVLTVYLHDDTVPVAATAHPTTPFTPASPTRSDDKPLLRGCANPGAAVAIFATDACTGAPLTTLRALINDASCPTGSAFSGEVTVANPASTTTFYGTTGNDAGLSSACANLGTFVFDAIAPSPPTLLAIAPPSPSAMTTPALTGRADAGTTVTVYRGPGCSSGVLVASATAGSDGRWTLIGSLEGLDTATRFQATATDDAGNTSSCAALATWVHDDIAPRPPTMVQAQVTAVPSPSNIAAPTVRFCSDTGTTVTAYTTTTCTGASALATVVTPSSTCAGLPGTEEQRFNLALTTAATYHLRAVDAAGNRSDCIALFDYAFDAVAPPIATVLRVRGANWTMLDANTVDRVDLKVAGTTEPGARLTFLVDGVANGSATADGNGRYEGTARAVNAVDNGPRRLQVRATDSAGNVGATSLERTVVGPLEVIVTSDAFPQPDAPAALQFPDGSTFTNVVTNASGRVQRRIFAGMGVTVGVQRPGSPRTTRMLETWLDLMPGDSIPVDFSPPAPNIVNGVTTELTVLMPQQQTGATAYLVQGSCGISERVTNLQAQVVLRFPQACAGPGERVDVLATALEPDPGSPFGGFEVAAYAFRADVLLAAQGSFVGLNPWIRETAIGSALTRSSLTIHNDTGAALTGFLQSQNLRGAGPSEFDISQLSASGNALGALYLLPGTSHTASLPFISELGPWRLVFGSQQVTPGESGFIAMSYEIQQGLDIPPASFGTRSVSIDLLPVVLPNPLMQPGPDTNRPRYGWFTVGSPAPAAKGDATRSLERADIASALFVGTHNCSGQCSDTGGLCTQDSDCGGGSCGAIECDELQWRVAWRPWDADTTFQVPTVPSGFTPTGFWSPAGQTSFALKNLAWMDLDFIAGWDEAKSLGRAVFAFGQDNFLNELLPEESTLLLSYFGDN